MGSFEHGSYECRVRGRRVGESSYDLDLARDHQGHGPELLVEHEELLRFLRLLPPRPSKILPR
jgi:hypothetical protein